MQFFNHIAVLSGTGRPVQYRVVRPFNARQLGDRVLFLVGHVCSWIRRCMLSSNIYGCFAGQLVTDKMSSVGYLFWLTQGWWVCWFSRWTPLSGNGVDVRWD